MNFFSQTSTTTDYDPSMFFLFLIIAFVFYAISSGLTVRIIKRHVADQQEDYARVKATNPDAIYQPKNLVVKQLMVPIILSAISTTLLLVSFTL